MSVIFATQLTAVATVALGVLALAASVVASIALRKQSRELAILAEQNERDIAERRQAQAARVYTGVVDVRPRLAHPYAKNGSDFPVYDAQFWQADPELGPSEPDDMGMIPPSGTAQGRGLSYLDARDNTFLTFRDAAGARWIRMPDGTIKKQERDTARDSILAALRQSPPEPRPSRTVGRGQGARAVQRSRDPRVAVTLRCRPCQSASTTCRPPPND